METCTLLVFLKCIFDTAEFTRIAKLLLLFLFLILEWELLLMMLF